MAAIKKYIPSIEWANEKIEMGESPYFCYYVGDTADIEKLYLDKVESGNWMPLFEESPIFSGKKLIYALRVEEKNGDEIVTVENSDTFLSLLLDGDIVPD